MLTLSDAIEKHISDCVYMKGLSEKTIKAYRIDLRQFKESQADNDAWCSKHYIESYIKHLYQSFKPKTAKRKIACLKAFFHYLELEELIEVSPFRKIKLKRMEPQVLPKTIPADTITKMLNLVYNNYSNENRSAYFIRNTIRDAAVIEMLFATGIRVHELCNLKPQDIDLKQKVVKVYGKGSKERFIQITNKNVIAIFKAYIKLFARQIKSCGYFFINNRGNRLSEQSVRFMIDKYAKQIDSDIHITPHMFRHTLATLLLEENVDIRYIQELLGHSSITTTQIYTHISMNAQKRILSKKHPRNKININIKP